MKGGPTPSSKGSDKKVNQFQFNQKKIKSKPSLKPNQPTIPEKENTKVQKEQNKKTEQKKIVLPLIKEPRPSVINQPNKTVTTVVAKKTPGRNEPCPCGSGKKYKQCCGRLS